MLHGIAEFGGVWAQSPLHFMQGMGHCIHSIHNKHDLGFLLIVGTVDGEVFVTSLFMWFSVLETALEFLLPEVLEPGIASVIVRAEALEILVKLFDWVGSKFQGYCPSSYVLIALDNTLLCSPPVAGNPGKRNVEAIGSCNELPRVITSHKEHHHSGVGFLEQLSDHAVVGLPDVGPTHFLRGGDADVAEASFLLKGFNPCLPVVSF